jgi:hypothetical protein
MFVTELLIGTKDSCDVFNTSINNNTLLNIKQYLKKLFTETIIFEKYYYNYENVEYNSRGVCYINDYLTSEIKSIHNNDIFVSTLKKKRMEPIDFSTDKNYCLTKELITNEYTITDKITIACSHENNSNFIKISLQGTLEDYKDTIFPIIDTIYTFHKCQ